MIHSLSFVLACTTLVAGLGDPVLLDNPAGLFPWTPAYFDLHSTPSPPGSFGAQELDVTMPPTQLGAPGDPFLLGDDHRFNYLKVVSKDPLLGPIYSADQVGHQADSRIAIGELIGVPTPLGPFGFWLPEEFGVGDVVGPGATYTDQDSPVLRITTPFTTEDLPVGNEVFLGVRFVLRPEGAAPTTHYGWVQMVAKTFSYGGEEFFDRFEPRRWAYEPTPDTPITISLDEPVDPWSDEGCALAGAAGDPALVGCGDLSPGSVNAFELGSAAAGSAVGLFVGMANNPTPFATGTLKPVPWAVLLVVSTDASGEMSLPFTAPGLPSGTELWAQAVIVDPAAPAGLALSNAVAGTTP